MGNESVGLGNRIQEGLRIMNITPIEKVKDRLCLTLNAAGFGVHKDMNVMRALANDVEAYRQEAMAHADQRLDSLGKLTPSQQVWIEAWCAAMRIGHAIPHECAAGAVEDFEEFFAKKD